MRAGEVSVITYHGVLPAGWRGAQSPTEGTLVSPEQLREQLRLLKSRYHLISPEAFRSWLKDGEALPERAVLLTCDDGLLNVLTDMVPILLEEKARCLFFVTGASLEGGRQSLWYEELHRTLQEAPGEAAIGWGGKDVRKDSLNASQLAAYWRKLVGELSALGSGERRESLRVLRTRWHLPAEWRMFEAKDARAEKRYGLLNPTELQEVVDCGMTLGAHTLSHPMLAQMSRKLAETEIRECKVRLETCVQREVWALAYPFGEKDSAGMREMEMAEAAGYDCAFLNTGGISRLTGSRFRLPRCHVTSEMSCAEFDAHLSGFHEALQRQFRNGWTE
jgi:peptidoglycan/xylan/chitin deacetylase (PgdA/CDA1 family)